MPAYIENADDEFDITSSDDWKELLDNTAPSNISASTDRRQEATLVGIVPFRKIRSCMRYFLGYAYTEDFSPSRLVRELPQPHPLLPWLRCHAVNFVPFIPKGNADEGNKAKVISPFYNDFNNATYTSNYEYVICTAQFRSFRMRFLKDDEIETNADEWKRFTYIDTEAGVEALQVTGGQSQLTFAEPTPGVAPEPRGGVTKFAAPLAELVAKQKIKITWLQVPVEYVSDGDIIFSPVHLDECLGHVNSDEFMEMYPAGTLLMDGYSYLLYPFPVAAQDWRKPMMAVDIAIMLSYFDPPKGVPGSSYRGHSLMPWSGDGTATSPGNGLWYHCTRDGDPAGDPLIPTATFQDLFKHWAD